MTEKYLSISEAVKKYQLNNSKFILAIRKASHNGLYKIIFRKRTRIFLREDYLANWLENNDVKSASKPTGAGRPKTTIPLPPRNRRTSKNKGYW